MMKAKRAALYLRVSTDGQTTANQLRELEAVAAAKGWNVIAVFEDAGISGANGRDKRPGFDAMLKDAVRRKFDVLMAWSVDRLGRSLLDLISALQELHSAGADLFLQQQAVDTTTPAGRAMFQMLGVFAEFERAVIQARVNAGIARAREQGTKSGKPIGRPTIPADQEQAILSHLRAGTGILKTAKLVGCGSGTVQRVRREMQAPA
ncbi:MAG TPA: recombinase family protein [Stellaceae bacterium]|nr:recombinase family protein [Stellaceae bacterium]